VSSSPASPAKSDSASAPVPPTPTFPFSRQRRRTPAYQEASEPFSASVYARSMRVATSSSVITPKKSTYTLRIPRRSASSPKRLSSVVLPYRRGAMRRALWPPSASPASLSSSPARSIRSSAGAGTSITNGFTVHKFSTV